MSFRLAVYARQYSMMLICISALLGILILSPRPHVNSDGAIANDFKAVVGNGSARGKRVLALGGAKNHLIVVPDAEPGLTAQSVVDSFTGCAGQRCMAASVLLAVGDVQPILDQVLERALVAPLDAIDWSEADDLASQPPGAVPGEGATAH